MQLLTIMWRECYLQPDAASPWRSLSYATYRPNTIIWENSPHQLSSQSTEAWIWCLVLHGANSEDMTTPGTDTDVIKHILILDWGKSAFHFLPMKKELSQKNKFLPYWSIFQPSPVVMRYELKQDSSVGWIGSDLGVFVWTSIVQFGVKFLLFHMKTMQLKWLGLSSSVEDPRKDEEGKLYISSDDQTPLHSSNRMSEFPSCALLPLPIKVISC